MHGFILFSICAVAVIAQDPLLDDLLVGSDLLNDLVDGKLTEDGAVRTVSAAAGAPPILLPLPLSSSLRQRALGFTTGNAKDDAALLQLNSNTELANLREGLLPPDGTAWRGSTHWPRTDSITGKVIEQYDPSTYTDEFGVRLHIYRSFKSSWNLAKLTPEEEQWVRAGGILWYGWQETDWAKAAKEGYKWWLQPYANAIKSVAPHKVMVCPGWEPDGHTSEFAVHNVFGSAQDYLDFRANVVKQFKSFGVTNAVYIQDYSHMPMFKPEIAPLLNDLFPDDGSVEWIFFNSFQQTSFQKYEKNLAKVGAPAQSNPDSKAMIDWFYNFFENDAKPIMKNTTLGIGAWGTNYEDSAPKEYRKPIPTADRERYIKGVQEVLESGSYPRIKASIHFDSLYSIITPCTGKITGMSDLAHGNKIDTYHNSNELVPTFIKYLKSEKFTANDQSFLDSEVHHNEFCIDDGNELGGHDDEDDEDDDSGHHDDDHDNSDHGDHGDHSKEPQT